MVDTRAKERHFSRYKAWFLSQSHNAKVYRVQFEPSNGQFPTCAVLKQYPRPQSKDVARELSLLVGLVGNHPHIVTYYYHIVAGGKANIFMEFCAKGSLAQEIGRRAKAGTPWTDEELRSHFAGLISAMHALHYNRIVHRDIKPENIFVTTEGELKLGDFGEAKQIRILASQEFGTIRGTQVYMSPQVLKAIETPGNSPNRTNGDAFGDDVWTMGRTFYEMALGMRRPDLNQIDEKSAMDFYAEIEHSLQLLGRAPDIINLISQMLNFHPEDRPSFMMLNQLLQTDTVFPCGKCGNNASRREPFPCGHLLCFSCFLAYLEQIVTVVTTAKNLLCPVCQGRVSLVYFSKQDFDSEATRKIKGLFLMEQKIDCRRCGERHEKYVSRQGLVQPYLISCKGRRFCSHCLQDNGHGQVDFSCPEFVGFCLPGSRGFTKDLELSDS